MTLTMEKSRRLVGQLLLIMAGAGGGVSISLFLLQREPPPPVKSSPSSVSLRATSADSLPPPKAPAHQEAGDIQGARLHELEKRLAAIETAVDGGALPQDEPHPPTPEEIEAQKARLLSNHQEAIEKHRREPVDSSWSRSTTELFTSDIESLEEKADLKLISVDCKTRSCIATIEWKSFNEAQSNYGAILHHPYAANCSREILLPEPDEPADPYQVTVVFDCAGWREAQH